MTNIRSGIFKVKTPKLGSGDLHAIMEIVTIPVGRGGSPADATHVRNALPPVNTAGAESATMSRPSRVEGVDMYALRRFFVFGVLEVARGSGRWS